MIERPVSASAADRERVKASPVPLKRCTLAQSIELIGDRYVLLILRSAMHGVRRFEDFRQELDAPRTVLAGRLKRMVACGLLAKQDYQDPGKRPRPEYILTELGESLQTVLIGLNQWGDRWFGEEGAGPLGYVHADSGDPVSVRLLTKTGREVTRDEVEIEVALAS